MQNVVHIADGRHAALRGQKTHQSGERWASLEVKAQFRIFFLFNDNN